MDMPFLDIIYQSNYIYFVHVWLFCFVWYFCGLFMLWHESVLYSFTWLTSSSIIWPFHILFIDPLIDIWVIPTFWPLGIVLLWTFLSKSLHRHMFSFLLGRLQEWNCWSMVPPCLTVWRPAHLVSKAGATLFIPTSRLWRSHYSPTSPRLVTACCFIYTIVAAVKW